MSNTSSWTNLNSAQEAFEQNRQTIDEQIARIKEQLETFSDAFSQTPKNWGYPGSLGYVMEKLNEISEAFPTAKSAAKNGGQR